MGYYRTIRLLNKKKKNTRRKSNNQKTNPSGFNKPTLISDELCNFLNIDKGSLLARTDVTRKINKYIKDNNLQGMIKDKINKETGKMEKVKDNRFINCNDNLHNLLKPTSELSYFNLQTYLSPHFKKKS